jgi:hypothetical protein
VESPFLGILALFGVVLLVGVTGGVVYLTLADWRDAFGVQEASRKERSDRPRLENETRKARRSTSKRK